MMIVHPSITQCPLSAGFCHSTTNRRRLAAHPAVLNRQSSTTTEKKNSFQPNLETRMVQRFCWYTVFMRTRKSSAKQ